MNTSKADAKRLLGIDTDADLARFFGVTRNAANLWGEAEPLPAARQWQLRALRPDLFATPAEPTTPAPSAAEQQAA